jgi:transposase
MYQLLLAEHGYTGAESTIRAYVGRLRSKAEKQLYVPLAYAPGETGQLDFGEGEVTIAGQRVTAHLFLMWLGYSGAPFVQAYPAETQDVFFSGHVAAFAFYGGVPQEIWYDNLTNAVQKVLKGTERKEQESFVSFRTHYLFKAEFCNTASGWEKGGVEGRVGYARRNWLVGAGEFESWTALNDYLLARCRQEQQRTLRGRSESIGVRLAVEREALRALPFHPYPCCKTVATRANHLALVTYDTNRYSVPANQARKQLTLRAYPFTIELLADNQVIATHKRCYGRQQDILDPLHYLALVAQRPGAFEHAQPLREWRQRWPPAYETLLTILRRQQPSESAAIRSFVQILALHEHHPPTLVQTAVEHALRDKLTTPAGVRFCLDRLLDPTPVVAPLDLAAQPALAELAAVGQQALSSARYDQFLSGAST